jgi:integrase
MTKQKGFGNIRKLPSGKYQARYWHEGQFHNGPQTYATKSEAQAWLRVQGGEVAKGTWTAAVSVDGLTADRITVSDLQGMWFKDTPLKRDRARDDSILRNHIMPKLGGHLVKQVTKVDCQALVDSWVTEGLAAHTVRRQATCLHALLQYAVDKRIRTDCPADGLRLPAKPTARLVDPSEDDYQRLAEALGPDEDTMMWVGAETGARWAEVAGLIKSDVDLGRKVIRISMQLDRGAKRVPVKTEAGKRAIPISDVLVEQLARHYERSGLTSADPSTYIFRTHRRGQPKPLGYSNYRVQIWKPACEKAGLPDLGFHDLRRANATALVDAGINLKVAQERLGHAQISTTLGIYARATRTAHEAAPDALAQRMHPATV